MNAVSLIGRFVASPELKTTTSGQNFTSFTLAVPRAYVKKGEDRITDFVECVAWRNTAEFICKYFQKGRLAGITGAIQTRTFEDRDGKKRKVYEVLVNGIEFCDKANTETSEPEDLGDLPF